MNADKHSIRELFQKDIRYIIPTFQRPYVWTKEDQWDPLWEDVSNMAERYEEELERADGQQQVAEQATGHHFLGAVVLQQISTSTAEIERRNVIDGQQRMTTLQLLLDAAQEVVETDGHKRHAKLLRRLVLNDDDFWDGDDRFKLWPTLTDRNAFRAAMSNGVDESSFEETRIVQAHRYFKGQISHWLHQAEDVARRVGALVTTLSGLLELVVIDLRSRDDAYVIFETLNARGTPLLASDLVKNFMLQLATKVGLDSADFHKQYWTAFEEAWWREDVRQGRIIRPRIDVLLNYWLIARAGGEVASHDVFPAFRRYVQESQLPIEQIAEDILTIAQTYRSWEQYAPTSPEGTFLYRWNVIQAGVITPLLLMLFSAPADELTTEQRRRSLKMLESFLIRRMACRMTTKGYNRLFLELIKSLEGRITEADDVIAEFLLSQTADASVWPSDLDFMNALVELPLYRLLTRGRMRVLLEGIEEAMRSAKAEDSHVTRGKLTIEHVMPQKWEKSWPLDSQIPPEQVLENAARRDKLKHTIGNLTLVNKKLNSSLSNSAWPLKQDALSEHSTLFLNKRLLSEWGSADFAESQIIERGHQLAKQAIQVWARPE